MKKRWITICLAMMCLMAFALTGCKDTMDDIIAKKPSVTGTVEEVYDNVVIIYSDTMEGYPDGARCEVPLDVEYKDSYTDLVVGDIIVVYHNGEIMEVSPLRLGTVYAITLKEPEDREINNQP